MKRNSVLVAFFIVAAVFLTACAGGRSGGGKGCGCAAKKGMVGY